MRISHRHKFIFFANPRTGSESLRTFLEPISDVHHPARVPTPGRRLHDHMRPVDARPIFLQMGWNFDSYYRFTTVRNPWRRLASVYAMALSLKNGNLPPFRVWLAATRPHGPGGGGNPNEYYLNYGTYSISAFAGDGFGTELVDDVFRMEDMERIPDMLGERGLPIADDAAVPHFNWTRGEVDYAALYDDKSDRLVRTRYAEDIERFGYEFPSGTYVAPNLPVVEHVR